jgi:hypothetical protein
MNANIAAIIGMGLFAYVAVNGAYMLLSPVSWAEAFWTAKGIYGNPERRLGLASSRERLRVRLTGSAMFALAAFGLLTIVSFYG